MLLDWTTAANFIGASGGTDQARLQRVDVYARRGRHRDCLGRNMNTEMCWHRPTVIGGGGLRRPGAGSPPQGSATRNSGSRRSDRRCQPLRSPLARSLSDFRVLSAVWLHSLATSPECSAASTGSWGLHLANMAKNSSPCVTRQRALAERSPAVQRSMGELTAAAARGRVRRGTQCCRRPVGASRRAGAYVLR